MSDQHPVHLTPSGPPRTVLDAEPPEALLALQDALGRPPAERRDALRVRANGWVLRKSSCLNGA